MDQVIEILSNYQDMILLIGIPLLDFLLKKVKSSKPLSIVDAVLDVAGYALYRFSNYLPFLSKVEQLVKKVRELYGKLIPERLKDGSSEEKA